MATQLHVPQGTLSGSTQIPAHFAASDGSSEIGICSGTDVRLGLLIGQSGKGFADGHFEYKVLTIDLDSPNFTSGSIPVPFLGHGLAFNPIKPESAVLFEKRGKGACEIDFKSGKYLRIISTTSDRHFYGHGTYSRDGKILFAAETTITGSFDGVIVMRDANSMEEIGHFPSYGARPHDCQLLADGKTMVITNGGGLFGEAEKGCVTYVDVDSQKLLSKLPIENKRLNAGHIAVANNGKIVVVSAPREGLDFAKDNGGVSIGDTMKGLSGGAAPRKLIESLRGESLSVCVSSETATAAATTPEAGRVTFWDINSGRLKHSIKINHPRGVTLTQDKQYYVINYDRPESKISLLDVHTLEPKADFDIQADITGSHIVSHAF